MVSSEGACAAYYAYGRYLGQPALAALRRGRAANDEVAMARLTVAGDLREAIRRKFQESAATADAFVAGHAEKIVACCRAMAGAFAAAGGCS